MWIDNHCHLDEAAASLVDEARLAGVDAMVCVGVTVEDSTRCRQIAMANEGVWSTAGVHPHDADHGIGGLAELLGLDESVGAIVAVGECGLDYHYDNSARDVQREVFASQIRLAHERNLPLVIHAREAWADIFGVLDAEGMPERTVFHSFVGGIAEATAAVDRGALLSLSGIVTFPGADELREAVAEVDLERLMVETDSPYLAPVPHRGKPNRPALVACVGEKVAEVRNMDPVELAAATSANARRFYGLPAETET